MTAMGRSGNPKDVLGRLAAAGLLLLSLVSGGLLIACAQSGVDRSADVGPIPTLSKDELDRAQIAAETRATQEKAARDRSASAAALQWAPFVTALVALAGVGLTLRAQRRDRQTERRKRHDEELARTVQNLGTDTQRVRLNSAAALTAFLGSDTPDLHLDLLTVIIANLKIETDKSVGDVLVRDLEIALRGCIKTGRPVKELDLARSPWLVRLDLSDVKLVGVPVDLAFANLFRANLSGLSAPRVTRGWGAILDQARLSGANLHQARLNNSSCIGAHFHKTKLVSATFKNADLRTAQFHGATLQGSHFERARLEGAVFIEADVSDAWFCDARMTNAAVFDEAAISTLARTAKGSWRKAHLAPAHRIAVEAHAGFSPAMPIHAARLVRRGLLVDAERWYERSLDTKVAVHPGALRKLGLALSRRGSLPAAAKWLEEASVRGDAMATQALAKLSAASTEPAPSAES